MTTTQTNVVFLNRHDAALIGYLERGLDNPSIRLQLPPDDERASLLALVEQADVLIGWGSDMELLERARRMKLYINPGTGIRQHLDNFRGLRASRDVVLANGHGNSYAVAQHTVALLLTLANRVIPHHLRMVTGGPRTGEHRTTYFNDITIGLLGYGAINAKVHRFLAGFDVRFAALRRHWRNDETRPTTIERFTNGQLDAFFDRCDVVINALPDTRFTQGIVGAPQFDLLGERGLFVNVGRGATVVQADLFHALKQRTIAGAAIEVWWARPPQPDPTTGRRDPYEHPFHELDNLVMSPHRGADSGGDLSRWDEVIENLRRVHEGRTDYLNVVDLDLEY